MSKISLEITPTCSGIPLVLVRVPKEHRMTPNSPEAIVSFQGWDFFGNFRVFQKVFPYRKKRPNGVNVNAADGHQIGRKGHGWRFEQGIRVGQMELGHSSQLKIRFAEPA